MYIFSSLRSHRWDVPFHGIPTYDASIYWFWSPQCNYDRNAFIKQTVTKAPCVQWRCVKRSPTGDQWVYPKDASTDHGHNQSSTMSPPVGRDSMFLSHNLLWSISKLKTYLLSFVTKKNMEEKTIRLIDKLNNVLVELTNMNILILILYLSWSILLQL